VGRWRVLVLCQLKKHRRSVRISRQYFSDIAQWRNAKIDRGTMIENNWLYDTISRHEDVGCHLERSTFCLFDTKTGSLRQRIKHP
jgi:hypothetical protein